MLWESSAHNWAYQSRSMWAGDTVEFVKACAQPQQRLPASLRSCLDPEAPLVGSCCMHAWPDLCVSAKAKDRPRGRNPTPHIALSLCPDTQTKDRKKRAQGRMMSPFTLPFLLSALSIRSQPSISLVPKWGAGVLLESHHGKYIFIYLNKIQFIFCIYSLSFY